MSHTLALTLSLFQRARGLVAGLHDDSSGGKRRLVLAVFFAAVVGHLVDLLFGFEVAGTAAVFWVVAGAGVGLARPAHLPLVAGRAVGAGFKPAPTAPVRARAGRFPAWMLAVSAALLILGSNLAPVVADTYAGLALRLDPAKPAHIAYAERAVAIWPFEPGHRVELGLLYLRQAQREADPRPSLEKAQRRLNEALSRRPGDPLAWSALGDVQTYWATRLRDEKVFFAAEASYKRAIELAPNMATLHASLGALELAGGRFDLAVESLERATGLDQTDARAFRYLSEAYGALGRKGDADLAAAIARRLDADAGRE